MNFKKDIIEDAVVRPVYSGTAEDFGINDEDLPEVEEMDNDQIVLDNVHTRTITEERQKIVTKTAINKFAIVGIIVGLLIVACGVCVILGLQSQFGLEIDYRLGYILVVMGAYMFCSFGMHVKQNEFQVETFTVEREVPIEGLPYDSEKMQQRETEIDSKVNEMADMFQKLAMLTSELEEKIVQREAAGLNDTDSSEQSEILAQAAATAVVAAMREERKNSAEYKEAEAMRFEAQQIVAEKQARMAELQAQIEAEQRRTADETRRREEDRRAAEAEYMRLHEAARMAEEEAARIAEEKKLAEEESARMAEEKRLAEEEKAREIQARKAAEEEAARIAEEMRLAEERRKAEEEAARLAEEMRLAEEKRRAEEEELRRLEEERRKAEEEAARIAEEIRLAEERRVAEEEARRAAEEKAIADAQQRLAALGLSASAYAWSSTLVKSAENIPAPMPEVKDPEPVEYEDIYEPVQEATYEEERATEVYEAEPVAEVYEAEPVAEVYEAEPVAEAYEAEPVVETNETEEEPESTKVEYITETESAPLTAEESVAEKMFTEEPMTEEPVAEEPVTEAYNPEESTGWNFGYNPMAAAEPVSTEPVTEEFVQKITNEDPGIDEEDIKSQALVEKQFEAVMSKNVWPEIPPMKNYKTSGMYGVGTGFSPFDEEPQLTEEEERQLAEERAARAERIQKQLSTMYSGKWDNIAPEDDFSDLDEGPIIIK
ncbi:MAG: hypothetical protein ACI39R_01930 [Lachnospiraceae bacterium]